jgi:tetratricopeptide (TPR) repeat protein
VKDGPTPLGFEVIDPGGEPGGQSSAPGGALCCRPFEKDSALDPNAQGFCLALIPAGELGQAVALARRGVELCLSDADALLLLAVALFESGELTEALEVADKAIGLNPVRPAYYCFFHAMILWGNERYQQAPDEEEECLRKAPEFGGAHTYRAMCLVGLGHLDEAKKLLAQFMASPRFLVVPPKPPELASRALAQLQAAGWRPTIAAECAAG